MIRQTQENLWTSQFQSCAVRFFSISRAPVRTTPRSDVRASFMLCLILHWSKIMSPSFVHFINLLLGISHSPPRSKFFYTLSICPWQLWNLILSSTTGYSSAQITLTWSYFVLLLGGLTTTIICNICSSTPLSLTFRGPIQQDTVQYQNWPLKSYLLILS